MEIPRLFHWFRDKLPGHQDSLPVERRLMTVKEWMAIPVDKRPYPTAEDLRDLPDRVSQTFSQLMEEYEMDNPPAYIPPGIRYTG